VSHPAFLRTQHRPWPLPARRWGWNQRWEALLFAHWPLPASALAPLLPADLELDTFEGQAWLGVVPFRMRDVRPRWSPSVPGISAFPELNVRTYVRAGGRAGVWFLSLDADNALAVAMARGLFHLPYFRARMSCRETAGQDEGELSYSSERRHRGAPDAIFEGSYRPTGPVFEASPGTLEHWLTERYCLFTTDRRGRLWRGDIHHQPWPLQIAEARIDRNSMASAHGLTLPECEPQLLFAEELDVAIWSLSLQTKG